MIQNQSGRLLSKQARHNEAAGKKQRQRRLAIRITATVLCLCLLMAIGIAVYGFSILSGMRDDPGQYGENDTVEVTDPPEDIAGLEELNPDDIKAPTVTVTADDKITNIMLFGLDARDAKQLKAGESDVMIILSLDSGHNKIKLTSIMRDILVSVKNDAGKTVYVRANMLFDRLGPKNAAKTLGEYFGVEIDHYVTVNFACTASLVDMLGGVEINVTSDEIEQININLKAQLYPNGSHQMKGSAGLRKLDGAQAVAYARIRHLPGSDFKRTERQRDVLEACLKKLPKMGLTDVLSFIEPMSKYIKTDLTELQMISYATALFNLRNGETVQLRIPLDGTYKNKQYNNWKILDIDFDVNAETVQKFLFDDVITEQ